ncbi:uncharacterized protein [Procambarus clarkii]|uniref:uncharacterized protein isoform X2 n=1 Tax=Procambarus clarkii TaxID=6728 RepID=UPI003744333A
MRMLLSMVMMVVVVVVESDVPPDSHLYSECAVKKNVEITTFEDSVKFGFVKSNDDDLEINFERGGSTFKMQYKNLAQHEWLQAELNLASVPELNVQGKIQHSTGPQANISGTRKTVTIQEVDILMQCPQAWANRELSSNGKADVRIPSSGKEESLVLTPTEDTKVKFSVSGNMRTLCWNTSSSGLAVVDEETESDCGDLKSNSPVTLKFLFEVNNVKCLSCRE